MIGSLRSAPLVLLVALVASEATAATYSWKGSFTKSSSPSLVSLHEAIHSGHAGRMRAYPVESRVWKEEDFKLEISSGTIYVEPAIEGRTVGAFFEGDATFTYIPRMSAARSSLRLHLGKPRLRREPIKTAYIFSLRKESLLTELLASGAGRSNTTPSAVDVYEQDKEALRTLGLELTTVYLNGEGAASDASYLMVPFEHIRDSQSKEARALYRMNPMVGTAIGFYVFGSDRITAFRPVKYVFHPLLSYSPRRAVKGVLDVEEYVVRMDPGWGSKTAKQDSSLRFKTEEGIRALRLAYTPRMEISAIEGSNGKALDFLQWKWKKNVLNFDPSILIRLPEEHSPDTTSSLTVHATGLLFEQTGSFLWLTEEDDWYPRFEGRDDAHHELTVTIPKNKTAIGIGARIEEVTQGQKKTVTFRTTQPIDGSTFYYGGYESVEKDVGGIDVELYLNPKILLEKKNANYVLGDIGNALEYFSEVICPLDIESLRAVTTPTRHARGFEGLILLGRSGTKTDEMAFADVSRAHEVAHQWWGNYVRIMSWPRDRWLFESLAETVAMDFYEKTRGDKGLEAIRKRWYEPLTFGGMERRNLAGQKEEMEGQTAYPLIAASNNVYTKGPMVLRMLRYLYELEAEDDRRFEDLVQAVATSNPYERFSTEDFFELAEDHFGADLDWFFGQWVIDGGLPLVLWRPEISSSSDGWSVTIQARQDQKEYRLDIPVFIHYSGGRVEKRNWRLEGKHATFNLVSEDKPTRVTLNDSFEVLAVFDEKRSTEHFAGGSP